MPQADKYGSGRADFPAPGCSLPSHSVGSSPSPSPDSTPLISSFSLLLPLSPFLLLFSTSTLTSSHNQHFPLTIFLISLRSSARSVHWPSAKPLRVVINRRINDVGSETGRPGYVASFSSRCALVWRIARCEIRLALRRAHRAVVSSRLLSHPTRHRSTTTKIHG